MWTINRIIRDLYRIWDTYQPEIKSRRYYFGTNNKKCLFSFHKNIIFLSYTKDKSINTCKQTEKINIVSIKIIYPIYWNYVVKNRCVVTYNLSTYTCKINRCNYYGIILIHFEKVLQDNSGSVCAKKRQFALVYLTPVSPLPKKLSLNLNYIIRILMSRSLQI